MAGKAKPLDKRRELSINTIIGRGTKVDGNIVSPGWTRVDGAMNGNLEADGSVVIVEDARMRSNVTGTAITIGGVVEGNVIASERLTILSTGLVLGDIVTRRIKADEGCFLQGRVVICTTDEKWREETERLRDIQAMEEASRV